MGSAPPVVDPRLRLLAAAGRESAPWSDRWHWALRGGGDPAQDLGFELFQRDKNGGPPRLIARIGVRFVSNHAEQTTWRGARFTHTQPDMVLWEAEQWPFARFRFRGRVFCPAPQMLVWDFIADNQSRALAPLDVYCWFEPIGGERPPVVTTPTALIAATPDAYVALTGRGFAPRGTQLHKATAHFHYLPMTIVIAVDADDAHVQAAQAQAWMDARPQLEHLRAAAAPPAPATHCPRLWTTLWNETRTALRMLPHGRRAALTRLDHGDWIDSLECAATAVALAKLGRPDPARELLQTVVMMQDAETGFIPARWHAASGAVSPQAMQPVLSWLCEQLAPPPDWLAEFYPHLLRAAEAWRAQRAAGEKRLCRWLDAAEARRPLPPGDPAEWFSVDVNAQLTVEYGRLAAMAQRLGREEEATRLLQESWRLAAAIRAALWNEPLNAYLDRKSDGTWANQLYPAAYWVLLCEAPTPEQVNSMTKHLSRWSVGQHPYAENASSWSEDFDNFEPLTMTAIIEGLYPRARQLAEVLRALLLDAVRDTLLARGVLCPVYARSGPHSAAGEKLRAEDQQGMGTSGMLLCF